MNTHYSIRLHSVFLYSIFSFLFTFKSQDKPCYIVTSPRPERRRTGGLIPDWKRDCLSFIASRPALSPTQPAFQGVPTALSPEIEWPVLKPEHTVLYTSAVRGA
jgi:hypothetical protein